MESDYSPQSYSRDIVESVWELAQPIPGNDDGLWRKDEYGAWINKMDYGKRNSEFGWEICDLSFGGVSDGSLASLRPMQWQNYLDQISSSTQSRVSSDGLHNVRTLF